MKNLCLKIVTAVGIVLCVFLQQKYGSKIAPENRRTFTLRYSTQERNKRIKERKGVSKMKKLFLISFLIVTSLSQSFSRVPADTCWRNVFNDLWWVQPAPRIVFVNSSGMYIGGVSLVSTNDTVLS